MFRFFPSMVVLLVSVFPGCLYGQNIDSRSEISQYITQFPFYELTGGVIVVRAAFNDYADSLNFILDTGSGAISLDSLTAIEIGAEATPTGIRLRGIAGDRETVLLKDNTLNLPGLRIDSLDFYVNNYLLLTSVYGIRIDGVIGYSLFSKYIVAIDYDQKIVSVYTNGKYEYPRKSYLLNPSLAKIPYHRFETSDERSVMGRYYIDTGAGLCVLMSERFVNDSALLKKKRRPAEILVQGSGGKQTLKLTVLKRLKIGPYKFKSVPLNIFEDKMNLLSYPSIGGLVGNDILRRFNVVIDYYNNVISLKPNKHFRDHFDYSYTGMNIYLELDGSIVIDDIVPRSPAEKAGLKNGDVILSVDRNFSGSITKYRDLLRQTGKRVEVVIERNGEMMIEVLKVGRIR